MVLAKQFAKENVICKLLLDNIILTKEVVLEICLCYKVFLKKLKLTH